MSFLTGDKKKEKKEKAKQGWLLTARLLGNSFLAGFFSGLHCCNTMCTLFGFKLAKSADSFSQYATEFISVSV